MPDSYYGNSKAFKTKRHRKKYNSAKHIRVGNYNRSLYRKTNHGTRVNRNYSIEYNNKWNNYNYSSKKTGTNIERSTFKESRSRVHKNTALFKAREFKEPKKSKKQQMGLWDPEMENWQSKTGIRKGKLDRDTTKEGKKIKKGTGVKKIK